MQEKRFTVKSISEKEGLIILGIESFGYPCDQLLTSQGEHVDKSQYRFIPDAEVYFNDQYFFLKEEIFNLYREEFNNSYRVRIQETNLPIDSEYTDYLISNQCFSTPLNSLVFGLLECLVRNPTSTYLSKKILQDPYENFELHYNKLFTFRQGPKYREFFSNFSAKYEDSATPENLQRICDDFSVGIDVTLVNNSKFSHFQLMPQFAEINPVPLLKFLSFKQYFVLFYSPTQNGLDGYNEKGHLVKGVEQGEFYVDSFYTISSTKLQDCAIKTIETLVETIEKLNVTDNVNADVRFKVNQAIHEVNEMMENVDEHGKEALRDCSRKLDLQMKKIEKNIKVPVPQNLPIRPNLNGFISPPKEIPGLRPMIAPQLENPVQVKKSSEEVKGELVKRGMPISKSVTPQSIVNAKPEVQETPGIIPIKKNQFPAWNQNPPDIIPPAFISQSSSKECKGCNSQNMTKIYHKNCSMCEKCYFVSLRRNKPQCLACNFEIPNYEKDKFFTRFKANCECCGHERSEDDLKITDCSHILCRNCYAQFTTWPKCRLCP